MSRTANSQTANYIWDVNELVPQVLQDGTNTYVYGLSLVSSTDGSGVQTYYTHDGLGSTTDLTNSSAAKTDGYTYDAFGTPTHTSGSSTNPFQFTGQQTDAESRLQYLRARYYDPSTGRFLGRDPAPTSLSNPAAGNPYAYVGSNPTSWTDLSGLWCPKDPEDCIPEPVKKIAQTVIRPLQYYFVSLPRFSGHLHCGEMLAQRGVQDGHTIPSRVPRAGGGVSAAA